MFCQNGHWIYGFKEKCDDRKKTRRVTDVRPAYITYLHSYNLMTKKAGNWPGRKFWWWNVDFTTPTAFGVEDASEDMQIPAVHITVRFFWRFLYGIDFYFFYVQGGCVLDFVILHIYWAQCEAVFYKKIEKVTWLLRCDVYGHDVVCFETPPGLIFYYFLGMPNGKETAWYFVIVKNPSFL